MLVGDDFSLAVVHLHQWPSYPVSYSLEEKLLAPDS